MFDTVRAIPKPNHPRNKPKRKSRGEFSTATRRLIVERDGGLCVRCGAKAVHIHHITYKSAGGLGTYENGASVCEPCHSAAHRTREMRVWFEEWRDAHLLKGEAENV